MNAINSPKATALARAQASSVLQNIYLTLLSNVAIAISISMLLYLNDGKTLIFQWLGAAIAMALLRAWWVSRMLSTRMEQRAPQLVLRTLTFLAFAGGLLWSIVPLGFGAFSNKQNVDYIAFIMVGTTTGSIIQSLACSRIAFAFGAPVMVSTLVRMIVSGGGSGYIITLDAIFMTFMLFRAALIGERNFVASQIIALDATDVANSLAGANEEVRSSNRALEMLARADPLTGLANRTHFRDAAQEACSAGRGVAFVLADIDSFKSINDTRGHDAGDRVIKEMANLLRAACHVDDLPVRLGGDEFIVLLRGVDVAGRSLALAERLASSFKAPLTISGNSLSISCSIGVAAHDSGSIDVEDLFARADAALYHAKDDGRACTRIFDDQMHEELALHRCIDLDLPSSLVQGRLHVEFQPQVAMADRGAIGFEALLRWRHPKVGMISPPDIVNAAIRLQLSDQLLHFIGEQACAFLCALDRNGLPPVRVAINVSPRELSIHSPAGILKGLTSRYGVDPQRVEIEITEEALFDPKQCARELHRIDQYGFGLAIDDFGVGHSSIANLMTIELDTVKIDRSFVHGIAENRQNQQLIAAIVAVSRSLGHRIIAEGVETEDEALVLQMLGCTYGQGWLYGRPMVQSEAVSWLTRNARTDAKKSAKPIARA
jgi:diguanylate cyclase (GGDEF)-like protein